MDAHNQEYSISVQEIIDRISRILKGKVEFALLFGSIITNRISAESDIDIGVYFNNPTIGCDEYLELKEALSLACGRDVDLVTMNTSDPIITMQILANGSLFINNKPELFTLFKAGKIGEYIDFKMDRKIIEENMLAGRIYA